MTLTPREQKRLANGLLYRLKQLPEITAGLINESDSSEIRQDANRVHDHVDQAIERATELAEAAKRKAK